MNYVQVRQDGDNARAVIQALKELKRQMKKDETLNDLQKHEFYLAPSAKRKLQRSESLKRRKRDDRKHEWYLQNKQNPES